MCVIRKKITLEIKNSVSCIKSFPLIQNTRIEIVAEFSILIENSATIFFVYILYGRYFHIWDSRLGVREILRKCQHFEKFLNMEENISKYGSFFLNMEVLKKFFF